MPKGKLTNKALFDALFDAVESGNLPEVEHLLNEGADVNVRGKLNWSPLHVACYHGHPHVATLLLDRGADMEARDIDDDTPLHWACINGHTEVARMLLDRGVDVGARDGDGYTPLDWACELPESDPAREPLLEIFRDRFPEAYFTKFCESRGKTPGRGM